MRQPLHGADPKWTLRSPRTLLTAAAVVVAACVATMVLAMGAGHPTAKEDTPTPAASTPLVGPEAQVPVTAGPDLVASSTSRSAQPLDRTVVVKKAPPPTAGLDTVVDVPKLEMHRSTPSAWASEAAKLDEASRRIKACGKAAYRCLADIPEGPVLSAVYGKDGFMLEMQVPDGTNLYLYYNDGVECRTSTRKMTGTCTAW